MDNELLPVGTIVKIRFSKLKYMILGYYVSDKDTKKVYDYVAVEYPIGLLTLNDVTGFSVKDVKKIIFKGLETDKTKELLSELKMKVEKKENIIKMDNIQKLGE